MEQKSKKTIPEINYFGDIVTDHIHAEYREGKFFYYDTNDEVILDYDKKIQPKGIYVKIVAPLHNILDEKFQDAAKKSERRIMDSGSILYFQMKYDVNSSNNLFVVEVKLLDDLFIDQIGHKPATLKSCRCIILNVWDKFSKMKKVPVEMIEATSLNQLFTQASVKLRPNNRSHSCNVFRTFKINERNYLDVLR